jgi:hypothetical protein
VARAPTGTCSTCGCLKRLAVRSRQRQLCSACYEATKPRLPCAECGQPRRVAARPPEGGVLCGTCNARRRRERCVDCGRVRPVTARRDGRPRCAGCWERHQPARRCGRCGKVAQLKQRSAEGLAICRPCWEKTRPVEICTGCGLHRPAHARTAEGMVLCGACASRTRPPEPCSVCRRLRPVAARTPTREAICGACLRRRNAEPCSHCGARKPVAHRLADGRAVCGGCRQRQLPQVTCGCGKLGRFQARAADGSPQCGTCRKAEQRPCARCGRLGPVARRWPDGPVCAGCVEAVLADPAPCAGCGDLAPVLRRDGDGRSYCPACSGVRWVFRCVGCGQIGGLFRLSRCIGCYRCYLVDELLDGMELPKALRPVLDDWLLSDPPMGVIGYLRASPARGVLRRLLRGELPVSHAMLDALGQTTATAYLRGRLIALHLLPQRDERLVQLHQLIDELVAQAHPDDRQLLRQYARWRVLPAAQRAEQPLDFGAARGVGVRIRVAAAFLGWLRQHDTSPAEITQSHLDAWTLARPSHRPALRAFLTWAAPRKLVPGGLEVPTPVVAEDRSTLDPAARWALVDRCLTDERIDPATRLAGCLVLLFGQFATRLVALPLTAIASDEQQVAICLGATPLPLPAPLDTLAVAAREHARAQQRTSRMWLFPGLIPGEHLSADQLRTRLRQLGIHRQLTARNTVWAALAAEVPPVVLAEKLGVSVSMADRWRVALGIDRARYVALIQDDQSDPPTGWSVSSQDP